jgi:hypothetical protein
VSTNGRRAGRGVILRLRTASGAVRNCDKARSHEPSKLSWGIAPSCALEKVNNPRFHEQPGLGREIRLFATSFQATIASVGGSAYQPGGMYNRFQLVTSLEKNAYLPLFSLLVFVLFTNFFPLGS